MSTDPLRKPIDTETVFIVDDDESVRASLERLMCSAGWTAQSYASAEDFLDAIRPDDIGCVLLDLQMADVNGLCAFARMRERQCRLPVVFLTGFGDVPSSVDAMKHGAVDFLLKPVDDDLLLRTIRAAIARYRETRGAEESKASAQRKLATLSRRERDVLHGVLLGKLNKQIAADLGIAEKTVKAHRSRVMEKTEASTVAGLVLICADAGASTTNGFPDASGYMRNGRVAARMVRRHST